MEPRITSTSDLFADVEIDETDLQQLARTTILCPQYWPSVARDFNLSAKQPAQQSPVGHFQSDDIPPAGVTHIRDVELLYSAYISGAESQYMLLDCEDYVPFTDCSMGADGLWSDLALPSNVTTSVDILGPMSMLAPANVHSWDSMVVSFPVDTVELGNNEVEMMDSPEQLDVMPATAESLAPSSSADDEDSLLPGPPRVSIAGHTMGNDHATAGPEHSHAAIQRSGMATISRSAGPELREWETNKFAIETLYIHHNLPLDDVMARMASRHNFRAT